MGGSIPLWLLGVLCVAVVGVAILSIMYVNLKKKLNSFMSGKDGASLEATLQWLTAKSALVDDTLAAHKEALEFIDSRVKRSIRGYSLVRYNAYGTGGEQSFSTGLLDEHKNGYILSVVSNRAHTGVYSKKITGGNPEVPLTDEEALALAQAQNGLDS